MIGALIGSLIGYKLGQKYLTPTSETPCWDGHVGGDLAKTAVSVTAVRSKGKLSYRVYVVADGAFALAAACWQWPEVLATLQQWERYINEGGSVADWINQNTQRLEEIKAMEEAYHA